MTYPPPPVPVFPAGYGPLPADFNTWIQAPFGFLTAQTVLRVQQSAAQGPFSTTSFNTITFNTVLEDPFSGWNASSHKYVVPFTGWYEITLGYSISTINTITEGVIYITGTTQYELSEITNVSSTEGGGGASIILPLIGGEDYVQGQLWTSAASSIDVSAAGRLPWMEIVFVSS
jgi:hypothetical protein